MFPKQVSPVMTAAILLLVVALSLACTADNSPATHMKAERNQLQKDLSQAIQSVDRRIQALEAQSPSAGQGVNGTNGGPDESPYPDALEIERLRQIRSALEYRQHQIDSTPDLQWRDFRTDAERLVNDARLAIADDTTAS